jgi:hypothetical protein
MHDEKVKEHLNWIRQSDGIDDGLMTSESAEIHQD